MLRFKVRAAPELCALYIYIYIYTYIYVNYLCCFVNGCITMAEWQPIGLLLLINAK